MNEIRQWLDSGADVQRGLRLLRLYAPNEHLSRLVSLNPERYKALLTKVLTVNIPDDERPTTRTGAFRQEWPFLQERDCPLELKILAADKITAYNNYVSSHERLFSCTSLDECFAEAKKLIENYIENRKIISEFAFYREHKKTLGKHPIYDEIKRLAALRSLSVIDLLRLQRNLEGAIWRINSEIRKGTKPHLQNSRERRRQSKQRELDEVNKILNEYATVQSERHMRGEQPGTR